MRNTYRGVVRVMICMAMFASVGFAGATQAPVAEPVFESWGFSLQPEVAYERAMVAVDTSIGRIVEQVQKRIDRLLLSPVSQNPSGTTADVLGRVGESSNQAGCHILCSESLEILNGENPIFRVRVLEEADEVVGG